MAKKSFKVLGCWLDDIEAEEKEFTAEEKLQVIYALIQCQEVGDCAPLDELPREIRRCLSLSSMRAQIGEIIEGKARATEKAREGAYMRHNPISDAVRERYEHASKIMAKVKPYYTAPEDAPDTLKALYHERCAEGSSEDDKAERFAIDMAMLLLSMSKEKKKSDKERCERLGNMCGSLYRHSVPALEAGAIVICYASEYNTLRALLTKAYLKALEDAPYKVGYIHRGMAMQKGGVE